MKETSKNIIRTILPLAIRKNIAVWLGRQDWIHQNRRSWWASELLRDLALKDINGYHRFLWSNHLSYAETYEVEERFGPENMNESRRIFFDELTAFVKKEGVRVKSVFEVGASLGYQLRHLETELFPRATVFDGIDIDVYAVTAGQSYLKGVGSRVTLRRGDMEGIDSALGSRTYDLFVCTGVLMYLEEGSAARVVEMMLRHTDGVLAISGLAHPEVDNSMLTSSVERGRDMSFIHNIDAMVKDAGGKVLWRRWDGSRIVDGNTIYSVFAANRRP